MLLHQGLLINWDNITDTDTADNDKRINENSCLFKINGNERCMGLYR